jgi:hypothetical protein
MNVPLYDIFSGHSYKDAVWLEVVKGLGSAANRMKQLAEQTPGPYFVFCVKARAVLASIDTSKPRPIHRRASA